MKNKYYSTYNLKKSKILIFTLFILFIINCGKKGPLKLEPKILPTQINISDINQIGKNIEISFSFPEHLSDNKTKLDLNRVNKIYILYSDKEIPSGKFKKKSKLLIKLNLKNFQKKKNLFLIKTPFKLKNLDNKKHYFAIKYTYGKKKSTLSNIKLITTKIPILPISDLKLIKERKLIKLKWSKPMLNLLNKNVKNISGYNIYRKIEDLNNMLNKKNFIKINKEKILYEYFEDTDTGVDGNYSYYVSTIITNNIQSDPSNVVLTEVKDIFPTETPSNLVSFITKGQIFLTWGEVKDKDLSYYRVYRRLLSDKEFTLIADKITKNSYKDTKVQKKKSYIYSVTSVDTNGNESEQSSIVKETY
jgi:fibronectin type 3 domain-containing protein/predicted small lipoprotein YifL